jgi:hypothetical protein
MNWPLALVIVGFLFIGGCALWVQAASDSAENFIDYAETSLCYDAGYYDGRGELARRPPLEGSDACSLYYADGYGDGEDGVYEPPSSSGSLPWR